MIEEKLRNIIWIDVNIYTYQNEEILNGFQKNLIFYKITPVRSVEEAFKEITNNYEDYKFNLQRKTILKIINNKRNFLNKTQKKKIQK